MKQLKKLTRNQKILLNSIMNGRKISYDSKSVDHKVLVDHRQAVVKEGKLVYLLEPENKGLFG